MLMRRVRLVRTLLGIFAGLIVVSLITVVVSSFFILFLLGLLFSAFDIHLPA